MKRIILILGGLMAFVPPLLLAQQFVNESQLVIHSGTHLVIEGTLTSEGSTLTNHGTLATSSDVTFSGSSTQTIQGTGSTTFGSLIINNSGGVNLSQNLTATSGLTLTAGILDLNGNTLTLGDAATIGGTPGTNNHVNATSGNLTKDYSGTGSFTFPIGDGADYSPISLNFTSGSFTSASASVGVTAAKHPSNSSSVDYLERYWTVSSSGISGFSCAVTATYDDGDLQGTEADMVGGKWDGASWTDLGGVSAASNQITGTVSSFSDFTAGEPSAFPVEWLNFSAKPLASSVQLDWATASELNADFFSIERSADQLSWQELGTVMAIGNSQSVETYEYQDEKPLQGRSWYRLRQVDLDGAFQYSSTVQVHFSGFGISLFPNPTHEQLMVQSSQPQDLRASLIDLQGRTLITWQLNKSLETIDLRAYPAGRYFLRLENAYGWQQTFPVVKE